MAKEIAAFEDEKGMTTLLPQACCLQVYRKQEGIWRKERNLDVNMGEARGLRELRRRIAEILDFLGSCGIVVAESFQGAALHELEKADISMWTVSGLAEPLLEMILAEEETAAQQSEQPVKKPFPALENRGDGRAYLSIVEIQRSGGGLTSKQVLMPILHQGAFTELEILCAHIPPWLEAEAASRHWACQTQRTAEQQILVTLSVP